MSPLISWISQNLPSLNYIRLPTYQPSYKGVSDLQILRMNAKKNQANHDKSKYSLILHNYVTF